MNEPVPSAAPLTRDEQTYLAEHALKKPLRTLDIWALGVGAVITGEYFGWNLGLKGNGAIAMLVASLIVCLLYLTWVLALSELSVAMPFAGGPLAYGRRACDPSLGFIMGWSMYLECQFATIATAIATGGYIAFLIDPAAPSPTVAVWAALGLVAIFFVLHAWGVKEQSTAMVLMTYGAIVGLVIFWGAAATNFSWDRIWTKPLLPEEKGWKAILDAVPYALWWLVIIETVALAAEEAHEPHRTIPRGLVWAQLTLIALVVLTWLFACGAMDAKDLAVDTAADGTTTDVYYPLGKAIKATPAGAAAPWLVKGFGIIALCGLLASYHGMVFGTSRQLFALGRAGYLPLWLGTVHATRRTPIAGIVTGSLITGVCVFASLWLPSLGEWTVLMSTLTALLWYILAVGCLFLLRKREPQLFASYRTPVYRMLPISVVLLSAFAAYVFGGINVKVVIPTAVIYAAALGYFWFVGYHRLQGAAPEELTARQSQAAENLR